MSKPNRKKGNAKASSSGKAAQLLQNSSGSLLPATQIGFGIAEDESVGDLDPNYRTIFRKLSKKDSLTRIKGLQDLLAYIEEDALDKIPPAYELWPRIYSKLALDGNFKIRYLSHKVCASFASKLGKNIGKQLDLVFPVWYMGQSDTYGDVSNVAKDSLLVTFPGEKFTNAVSKFHNSILQVCTSILKSNGDYMLLTLDKVDEIEEAESRKLRIWGLALETLANVVADIKHEHFQIYLNNLDHLLANHKKVFKTQANVIHHSIINLTRALINRNSEFVIEKQSELIVRVIQLIDCPNANFTIALWECILIMVQSYAQKMWTLVNIEKMLLPKLVSILRKANGATIFGPCIISVLGSIPKELIQDKSVCLRVSEAAFKGCMDSTVKDDVVSLIEVASDCMNYAINIQQQTHNNKNENTINEYISLITTYLSPILTEQSRDKNILNAFSKFVLRVFTRISKLDNSQIYFQKFNSNHATILKELIEKLPSTYNFGCSYFAKFLSSDYFKIFGAEEFLRLEIIENIENSKNREFLSGVFDIENENLGFDDALNLREIVETLMKKVENQQFIPVIFQVWNFEKDEQWKMNVLEKLAEIVNGKICLSSDFLISLAQFVKCETKVIVQFIKSHKFDTFWLNYLKSALKSNNSNNINGFKKVFPAKVNNVLVLPSKLIELSLDCLLNHLEFCEKTDLDSCIAILSHVSTELIKDSEASNHMELAMRLNSEAFCMYLEAKINGLSDHTISCLHSLWTSGLQKALSINNINNACVRRIVYELVNQASNSICTVHSNEQFDWIELCLLQLLVLVRDNLCDPKFSFQDVIVHSLLPDEISWKKMGANLGNEWEYVCALYANDTLQSVPQNLTQCQNISFILSAAFCVSLLDELSLNLDHFAYKTLLRHCFEAKAVVHYLKPLLCGSNKSMLCHLELILSDNLHKIEQTQDIGGLMKLAQSLDPLCVIGIDFMVRDSKFSSQDQNTSSEFDEFLSAILLKNAEYLKCVDFNAIDLESGMQFKSISTIAKCGDIEFDDVMKLMTQIQEKDLICTNLSDCNLSKLQFNLRLISMLSTLVYKNVLNANSQLKDRIFCLLVGNLQCCAEATFTCLNEAKFGLFAANSLKLFSECHREVQLQKDETLKEEWNEFFLEGCSESILTIFSAVAEQSELGPLLATERDFVLQCVAPCVNALSEKHVMAHEYKTLLHPELQAKGYNPELQTIILNICPLLSHSNKFVQLNVFYLISKILPEAAKLELADLKAEKTEDQNEGDEKKTPPFYLLNPLIECYNRLSEKIVKHEIDLDHDVDFYCSLSGYLLCWHLLDIHYYTKVKCEARPAHSAYFKESGLLNNLMLTLFSILPQKCDESVFDIDPWQSHCIVLNVGHLENASVYLYSLTLQLFPAAVRTWYSTQNKNLAMHVDRFTSLFVSPYLCKQELKSASGYTNTKTDNMAIYTRGVAREVLAVYKLDEMSMELVVSLPDNYPLSQPKVSAHKRVGVAIDRWRKWMLHLTAFLTHQNGCLLDGLLLWKSSIDSHLLGIEDCPICFMAVHSQNYQLPRATCRQCKKKFHASCLYKWFNSSHNTSCPLCRTEF